LTPSDPFLIRPTWITAGACAFLFMSSLAVADDEPDNWRGRSLSPMPQSVPELADVDPQKVRLGEMLFYDPRLSKDNSISCASCHNLSNGGVDGRTKPIGIDGQEGSVNTPTVFNSTYNFTQFWNGRAESLEEQASGPVHNPSEMGSNWDEVVAKLNRDPFMTNAFKATYNAEISAENIVDAIATFERTLVTVNAPFDQYLKGDMTAITPQAANGYALFVSYGCAACHQGVNVGGNMYQTMGAMEDYFKDRGDIKDSDMGRYQITGREQDRFVFKVPSLRVAALTAPYFHDGSAKTLNDAVRNMAKYQLGREIAENDIDDIVAFLESLVGEYKRFDPQ